ncbi:MAG: hypothetical protein HY736_20985 [Verrucomicrobia bacterium]|nr:hypothetical protein [Verrucomicrobiota bacterium]
MNSPDQNPRLPMWIFYVADAALLGAAWFIASRSAQPLSTPATLAIVACVITGAAVALVPLVARFERQKNEMLDDRQRALEALARTVSASAEQISIAASGLHQIAELAQKNLRHAEQLPHKLQDKIAEFQAQLANVNDAEKEELERELVALRTTESERLDSISDKIAKSAAEWSKLEVATHQHLSAASEAIARLSTGTASAIGKAQAAAEQAMGQARVDAARAAGDASGSATRAIDTAKAAALAEIDAKLARAGAAVTENFVRDVTARIAAAATVFDEKISRLESAAPKGSERSAAILAVAPPEPPRHEAAAHDQGAPPSPKRPRRPHQDAGETPTAPPSAAAEPTPAPGTPPAEPVPATAIAAVEPPPISREKIVEITPVVPSSAPPFSAPGETSTGVAPLVSTPAVAGTADAAPAAPPAAPDAPVPRRTESPRKRSPKKAVPDAERSLGLSIDEPASAPESGDLDVGNRGLVERILTSDGATRLLVTAYIGIGNRLFIRGDGPGLSWEKGVPLQFVSIGKWRWETNDAAGPVKFKLFKNDDVECSTLGVQSLDPGHQQEVTAAF